MVRYAPDTCGCVFEFEGVVDDPPDPNLITNVTVIQADALHDGRFASPHEHVLAVINENQRKNIIPSQTLMLFPALRKEVLDDKGNVIGYEFRSGRDVRVSFGGEFGERTLTVSPIGFSFTAGQRQTLQAWCDARWPGKVVVDRG